MVSLRSGFANCAVVGALAIVGVTASIDVAQAADLNPYAYNGKTGSPYSDPRYAELYGPDHRHDTRRRHQDYVAKYNDRHAEADRYRDHRAPIDRHYRHDAYRKPRHDYVGRHYDRYGRPLEPTYERRHERPHSRRWQRRFALAPHCVPRRVVMRRLFRDGWHDFHGLALQGPQAQVRARSDDGRLFALTIERCSGEIVAARQVEYRHTNGRYNGDDPRAYTEVPYRYRSYK